MRILQSSCPSFLVYRQILGNEWKKNLKFFINVVVIGWRIQVVRVGVANGQKFTHPRKVLKKYQNIFLKCGRGCFGRLQGVKVVVAKSFCQIDRNLQDYAHTFFKFKFSLLKYISVFPQLRCTVQSAVKFDFDRPTCKLLFDVKRGLKYHTCFCYKTAQVSRSILQGFFARPILKDELCLV